MQVKAMQRMRIVNALRKGEFDIRELSLYGPFAVQHIASRPNAVKPLHQDALLRMVKNQH
jgi:hypothetical protein